MENPDDEQGFPKQEEKLEEDAGSELDEVSDEDDEEEDGEDDDEDWGSDENGDDDDPEEEEEDDDDDENDGEEEEDDDDEDAVLVASDSDGEPSERCPICLNRFTDQDIGTPESCDHVFCLECIQEWSRNVNTCPVDRQVFRLILCKHGVDDVIYKKLPVEDTNKQAEEEEVEEEPTYCEVCHQCDREDRLLLCDGCDMGYHLDCLTPPLSEVPVEEWFCPSCARREGMSAQSDADYVPHAVSRYRRQIPRTLVMERVRSAIEERRVRRTQNMRRLLSSDEEEEEVVEPAASSAVSTPAASTSSPSKKSPAKKTTIRRTTRKYSKKTKRKTGRKRKRRKTPKKRKVTKKTRRIYRKGKKGKKAKRLARTARPVAVTTVKTRIAGALGLTNPPPGRTIPLQKLKQEKTLDMRRTDIGAASLSIFGSRDEIIHFEDEQAEPVPSSHSSGEPAATRKYSRLALSSCQPIGRVPTVPLVSGKKKIVIKTSTGPSDGGVDLLGSIMHDQSKLHMSSKNVTIHRDGSLTTKPVEVTKKTPSKPSEKSSANQNFRSSFTAVKSSAGEQTSVLSTLSSEKDKPLSPAQADEEYDPAFPTDEMEEENRAADKGVKNQKETEDVYDPAHPTDDLSSDEEMIENIGSGKAAEIDVKQDLGNVKAFSSKELEKVQISDENKEHLPNKNKGNSVSIEVKKVEIVKERVSVDKHMSEKLKPKVENDSDKVISGSKVKVSPAKKDQEISPKKLLPEFTFAKGKTIPVKVNTAEKNEKEMTHKSPSVKITESKKSSIKPFEISRKTLFEKRRLYGGEIDFSEDVDFSEGAFPETFELNVKRIEEVFKGTKSKQAQEQKKDDPKTTVVDTEKSVPEKDEKKSSVENLPKKEDSSKDTKEKVEKEKTVLKKENKPNQEEKKVKSEKDKEKIKFTGKFKPISTDADENIGTTKISVSDRFKKINEERKSPEIASLDEEDPIHEMRKLDKELDLEFGNSGFSKKKDKDKEPRKSKRKVSLDENEGEYLRHRRESKENKEKKKGDSDYFYEEKEEGEVEEDYKLKEKKRRDKKKRREKDKYHDSDYKENADSDIDRRIVIQVTQNTEDRTVWEEAERQRKKRDREERRKEKEKHREGEKDIRRDRRTKRLRSRSRSHERRNRSRSRERRRTKSRSRDRDRSRERARRKRRGRSRSRSRDWSYERSHKKKKRDKHRSRDGERDVSRERSRDRSVEREWSRDREWSSERARAWSRGHSRDRKRSRDSSEDKVDIFGRSKSPFTRRELLKSKQNLTPRKKIKQHIGDDEVIEIPDSTPPSKNQTYDEVSSSESEKEAGQEHMSDTRETVSKSEKKNEPVIEKITVSRIEVKESAKRESSNFADSDEKDDEFDDEPEETEQFQYTDRDEFLGQNKSKQMRQNLITIGVSGPDYDPANPTETTSPAPPPLPETISAPTPPLPPGGDFTQFPPPPPGPPPQGPPPGSVILQEHPIHVQASGPPGQGILGEGPILLQGPPPPSLETGPPPGLIQQRPAMSVPVNINVLPPGFHRGLPPTITPQRQVIVSPIRTATPRVQRLASPGGVRFGWQVTTTPEVIPSQFGSRIPSTARLPGQPMINGPFDGLPPPHSEALPPQSLPPGHPQFPQGEPHVITIKTDTPPPNIVQIPVEVNEAQRRLPPGAEPQLIHLGPDPRAPPPQLPIPLLPPSSEPPPMSVMVSIPPPNSSLMSMPPPNSILESFPRTITPPNSVSAILGLARMGTGSMPIVSSADIQGSVASVNGDSEVSPMNSNSHLKTEGALNELEKISELLNTQAQLMAVSKDRQNSGGSEQANAGKSGVPVKIDVFKVPMVPVAKAGMKNEVDATEVVDMDMGSPINEEGNIELPVSPQFDNLIDNPEDLLEEDFNKKMQKNHEKDIKGEKENDKVKEAKSKDIKNLDSKKDSPLKVKDGKHKHHDKRSSKENKHDKSGHKSRKHKPRPDSEKDLKEKALKDAHFDLDSQEVPSSAVEMTNKEKYLKKLHLQERVVEEVKMAIKPFYSSKKITKEQYKEILRKAVPKICHSKSGNINPMKIKHLVEAYVAKFTKQSDHSKMETDNFSPVFATNGDNAKASR